MITYRYSLIGGYLTAIEYNGKNIMYSPDPRSWGGTDVAIFPFVARLKEGKYTVDGKEYSMKNHGLARYNLFKVVEEDEKHTLLVFNSNEETRKQYPFDFSFQIRYERSENGLSVTYIVTNTGDREMPFGIGAHPSFKLPSIEKDEETDISGNYVEFEEESDIRLLDFEDTYCFIKDSFTEYGKVKRIDLCKELFRKRPTLLFDSSNIHSACLVKKDGSRVKMEFDSPYFVLWSHPQYGDYACLEPWMSLPDYEDAPSELSKKKTLLKLGPSKTYTFSYRLRFE